MGHMDVIAIVSDGFNIYFPTVLLILSVATYFSLGSRLLSALGFHQFVDGDDEMTADLVEEGRDLVKRGIYSLILLYSIFNLLKSSLQKIYCRPIIGTITF
jgi:hypothetical protein